MQNGVRIIIIGQVVSGFDRDEVAATLSKMFQVDKSEALSWLSSEETVVRSGVPEDQAERHIQLLNGIGACARFESEVQRPPLLYGADDFHSRLTNVTTSAYRAGLSASNQERLLDANELALVPDVPVQSKNPSYEGHRSYESPVSTYEVPVETETPRMVGLSMTGRIGRLRYIVYSLFGFLTYAVGASVFAGFLSKSTLAGLMFVFISLSVLFFWLSIRAVVLRLHDIGLSGLWIFAAWGIPLVIGTFWPSKTSVDLVNFMFLAFVLILSLLPGESLKNNFGPPSGPNTISIKLASVFSIGLLMFPFFAHHG